MKYKINSTGNCILADKSFMDTMYPGDYTQLPDDPVPELPVVPQHITVGAFFDRFGALKWAILADTNPGVQALIKDCSVRKYIDLGNPELPYGLDMLIAAGHTIDKSAILTTPILEAEKP